LGNICEWANKETRGLADIRMHDKNPRGLSATYAADKQGKWAFFEPLSPIEGFPAVAYDITDERSRGECAIAIGVSNEIAFDVSLRLSADNVGAKDPCETAATVAGMMLQTMKGER